MKKLLFIAAFAAVVSLAASFGSGRIEIRTRPVYDQNRDQQWMQSQQNQRMERERRDQWQRDQWEREQYRRNQRHERPQNYEIWLRLHVRDYDNSHRD